MAAQQTRKSSFEQLTDRCLDCSVTLLCWTWFILGFFLFFSWRYGAAALLTTDKEIRFQGLNSLFFQIFFRILKLTAPRQQIKIDKNVAAIRSSVIVCNHLSYLDPLLLIALFERHRTIVKTRFFSMPVFGWIVKKSGYLPATAEGKFSSMMIEQMETMGSYFRAGGILFVFPEGTRSRDGKLGTLNKGALKIARLYEVPIYILRISNTDKLFTPGKFFFTTRTDNTIRVTMIDCIEPDYQNAPLSPAELEQRVRQAYQEQQK
jgi:1-acyl-sn-glycerol-3-phosphate acyltransferase